MYAPSIRSPRSTPRADISSSAIVLPLGIALPLLQHHLQLHELAQPLDVIQMHARLPDKIQVARFPDDAADAIGQLEHAP
jgi:hypothetical protein